MLNKILGTFGTRLLNLICGFITLLIGTHQLGAEQWGIGATVLLDVSLCLLIIELLAGPGLIYYTSRVSFRTIFKISAMWTLGVCAIIGLIFYALYSFAPSVYHYVVPKGYGLLTLAIVVIYSFHNFNMKVMLGKERVQMQNVLALIQFLVQFVTMILFVFAFDIHTAHAFVWSLLCGHLSGCLVGFFVIIPYLKDNKPESLWSAIKKMMNFGLMLQLSSIVTMLNRRLSYFIINKCLGMSSVGVYGSATQISEATKIVPLSFAMVQFSAIANLKNEEKAVEITLNFLKTAVFLTFCVMLVACLLPVDFYIWVLTEDFAEVRNIVIALSPGMVFVAADMIFSHYFSGTNRPKYNLYGALIVFAFTIVTVYPFIHYYGCIGAGITISVTTFAAVVYKWAIFKKLTGVKNRDFLIKKGDFAKVIEFFRNN